MFRWLRKLTRRATRKFWRASKNESHRLGYIFQNEFVDDGSMATYLIEDSRRESARSPEERENALKLWYQQFPESHPDVVREHRYVAQRNRYLDGAAAYIKEHWGHLKFQEVLMQKEQNRQAIERPPILFSPLEGIFGYIVVGEGF